MYKCRTGMNSVTFRQKSIDEIIDIAKRAGLSRIEWGGDVHLPPGDTLLAARTAEKTRSAGLEVLSYGSYYHGDETEDFTAVLATAKAVGAPVIRVWPVTRPLKKALRKSLLHLPNGLLWLQNWRKKKISAFLLSTTAETQRKPSQEHWHF